MAALTAPCCITDFAWTRQARVALDLETTGLDPRRDQVLLLGLATEAGGTLAIRPTAQDWKLLADWLNGPDAPLVIGHNLAFDLQFLWGHGVHPTRLYDTMLAETILYAGLDLPVDLASVLQRRRGVYLDKSQRSSFIGADPATWVPSQADLDYLAGDIVHLIPVALEQGAELQAKKLMDTARLEMRVLPAFAAMSLAGFRLDRDRHAEVLADYQARTDLAAAQVTAILGPVWDVLEATRLGYQTPRYESGLAAVKVAQEHVTKVRKDLAKKSPAFAQADLDWAVGELAKARESRKLNAPKPTPAAPFNLNSRDHLKATLDRLNICLDDQKAQTLLDRVQRSLVDLDIVLEDNKPETIMKAAREWVAAWGDTGRDGAADDTLPTLVPLVDWKSTVKVVGTYGQTLADKVGPDGRVHGSFRQMVSTGRAASSGPNMQNMPPDIRDCFIPEDGNALIIADFSGMELRLAAALSGDPVMIQAFRDGADLHKMTAATAFQKAQDDVTKDERAAGKTVNFGILYGISARGLEARGLAARGKGGVLIDAFGTTYPTAMKWRENQGYMALSSGQVRTALGRARFFPMLGARPRDYAELQDWKRVQASIRREAGNAPIQGTGADVAKLALAVMWEAALKTGKPDPSRPLLGLRFCPVDLVHDEVVMEGRQADAPRILAWMLDTMAQAGRDIVGDAVEIPAEGVVADRWHK